MLYYHPTGRDLSEKTISLDGVYDGSILGLDVHNLYGTMQVRATHNWFEQNQHRTMIISRSSYSGMG